MRQFKVSGVCVSIYEAFPSGAVGKWMPVTGSAITVPGTFDWLDSLWYALSMAIGSDYLKHGKDFTVSNISDEGCLLRYERLAEYNYDEPTPERLQEWIDGKAFLFKIRYYVSVTCEEVSGLGSKVIQDLFGIPESGVQA